MKEIILSMILLLLTCCHDDQCRNDAEIEDKKLISLVERFINETKHTRIYSDSKFIELSIYNDRSMHIKYIPVFDFHKIVGCNYIVCQKIEGKRILISPNQYDYVWPNREGILQLIRSEYNDYDEYAKDTIKNGKYTDPILTCDFNDKMELIDSTYELIFYEVLTPILER